MKKDSGERLFVFVIFFILSLFLIFFSQRLTFLRSFLETVLTPFQSITFKSLNSVSMVFADKNEKELAVSKKTVDINELQKDLSALKDQFATEEPKSDTLIPVKIVGMPGFIPAVSMPEKIILGMGSKNKIKKGQAVIYKNNLVGKISNISPNLSVVDIITNSSSSFTAKAVSTNNEVMGVLKGKGNGDMVLDNVLLSDQINKSDIVVTKGDLNADNLGFPPGLIVGKVISVDKKPSDLFQKAKVKSLLDFSKLSIVFVRIE